MLGRSGRRDEAWHEARVSPGNSGRVQSTMCGRDGGRSDRLRVGGPLLKEGSERDDMSHRRAYYPAKGQKENCDFRSYRRESSSRGASSCSDVVDTPELGP